MHETYQMMVWRFLIWVVRTRRNGVYTGYHVVAFEFAVGQHVETGFFLPLHAVLGGCSQKGVIGFFVQGAFAMGCWGVAYGLCLRE